MNSNNSNNLYDLEKERKRIHQMRLRRTHEAGAKTKQSIASPWRQKFALYGQVAIFLIMVAILMFQCGRSF